jgi:hypothetical protein
MPRRSARCLQRSTRLTAKQIDEDDDVDDQHGRHIDYGEIVGGAELGRIDVGGEGGEVGVGEVEEADKD